MSISVFQEKIIKGGCGKFVLVFCGAAMVFGMAFSNCSRGQKMASAGLNGQPVKAFATVGEVELPSTMLNETVDRLSKQSNLSQYPPEILEMIPLDKTIEPVIAGVMQTVQVAEVYEMAKKAGFKSDDESVKKALHLTSEADFEANILERAKLSGEVREDATIKQVEEMLKPQLEGKTLKDIYPLKLAEVEGALKDPQKKLDAVLSGGQQFLRDKLTVGINPSDDEVKKSFETIDVKQVAVRAMAPATDATAKAKIDKAYADLKAGKSFEDVMNSYTEEPAKDPKKKKSDNSLSLGLAQIEQTPEFKVIPTLQPGAYSEPVKVAGGYTIFKNVGKKVDIPKDYETNKRKYKSTYANQLLGKKFKGELEKFEKDVKPTFETKAYEAAYRYGKAATLPEGAAKDTEIKAVYDLVKAIPDSEDKADLAATLQVVCILSIYDAPTADKAKLNDERIAAYEKYLAYNDRWSYRKEVIDYYKTKGDKTKAFDQVYTALDKNTKFDAGAQRSFSDISAKFQEIKTAGLVSADQESKFNIKRDQWRSDKEKYDKEEAELKKQKDEDAKKAAEEAKKAKGNTPPPTSPTPPKKAPGK